MKPILIVCLILMSCNSNQDKLPILSYSVNEQGVKQYYGIRYQGFKNQLNEDLEDIKLNDKVFIANFFFTRCPSICPPMRQQLMGVSESIDSDDFLMVSHTIDPNNDTPEVLKDYAEATGISSDKWLFLTASEALTKAQAEKYKTNFKPHEDGTDFYHSSYVALVDKGRMIRGFYDVLKPRDVELLIMDIGILLD